MELKYLLILSFIGLAAGYTVPTVNSNRQGETSSDLESSFPSSDADTNSASRDKRDLLKKIFKKHHDTTYVNRRVTSDVEYRPNREVHHHHHYSYQQPPQTYQPYHQPAQEYHHYHGASSGYQQGYASQGSEYYQGGYASGTGYYPRPNYGDGGYAHYGVGGHYSGPPPQQESAAPVSTVPVASGHNSVDRGQGAAAVNNIAIIHARAGSTNNLVESESRILPKPLPVDIDDVLNRMAE